MCIAAAGRGGQMSTPAEDRSVLTRPAPGPDEVRRYGDGPDQLVEVFRGDGRAPQRPLVVLIHGGFWRPGYDRTHIRPLADALRKEGRTVLSIGYRREPGDPDASMADVRTALVVAAAVATSPVVVVGHSAGGHLALWAAAAAPAPGLVGTVALAPVADLSAADHAALGDGAVRDFLGGSPDRRPDLDPVRLNTPDTPVLIVHGEWDAIVPVAQAYRYRQTHPRTEIEVVPGADHFSMIDPLGPAWTTVRDRLLMVT
jgi:acetyl esterase/lipase